jgi:inorganic pyrophosphatase
MTDEAGEDAKLVAVPHAKLTQLYDHINDIDDLPRLLLDQIREFFENYKNLEPGKWAKVESWQNAQAACAKIMTAAQAYQQQS